MYNVYNHSRWPMMYQKEEQMAHEARVSLLGRVGRM